MTAAVQTEMLHVIRGGAPRAPLPNAVAFFSVEQPLTGTIVAEHGDMIAIMPRQFPQNVWVLNCTDVKLKRSTMVSRSKLRDVLHDELNRGRILFHSAPYAFLLHILVADGQVNDSCLLRIISRASLAGGGALHGGRLQIRRQPIAISALSKRRQFDSEDTR